MLEDNRWAMETFSKAEQFLKLRSEVGRDRDRKKMSKKEW